VFECAQKLSELRVGALMVMVQKDIKGIVSERDLVSKVVSQQKDPAKITVKDIMTSQLLTVTSDMTVHEAMKLITERRIRHLPVVENNILKGMISIGDLTKAVMLQQEQDIADLTDYIQGGTK
jgi:CBS domain-containing protein